MTQTAAIIFKVGALHLELPSPNIEIMPGVRWGAIDAFPTPAYWVYQVVSKRVLGGPPNYKLGQTLAEEVGACLLGGHGIPAAVGLAAFARLRSMGAFSCGPISESKLLSWLEAPLDVGGRSIKYRFARQKARYLAEALKVIHGAPTESSGRVLRDWLLSIPGIGCKTASWIARNWKCADDVAILDIHILRFGQAVGLFPDSLTVERHYQELEELFLQFSRRIDVLASELDAVIWHEMASSPNSVKQLLAWRATTIHSTSLSRPNKRHSHSEQLTLSV